MSASENSVVRKHKRKEKVPDVEAGAAMNEKKHDKKRRKEHQDQLSIVSENKKEPAAGEVSASEIVVVKKHKRKEKAPDVEAGGAMNEKKHPEAITKIGPGGLPSDVRERLILIRKRLDERDLAAGSKGKESNGQPKTYRDDFLGKEVPVTELEGKRGGCAVCGSWDHCNVSCPCLKYFPKGTKIGADYETICRGCGRIGEVCCPKKGGYALLKECDYCRRMGHWQWEDSEECCRLNNEAFEKPEFLDVKEEEEEEDPDSIIHPKIMYCPPWRHGNRENA